MVSHPDVRTENEKYLAVRTGQDLVDLGVRPKTSSQHLSLITRLRLEAIRDEVLRTFDEEVLGKWVPALVPINPVTVGPVIDDAAQVLQYAAVGMRAKVTNQPADNTLMGLEGRIVTIESGMIGVEFDTEIPKGYVLNGKARDGHGWKVRTKDIALMLEKPLRSAERYELATGVVADATLGFKVRFSSPYRGILEDRGTVEIPADTTGTLTEYHPRKQTVKIQFDSPVNTLQGIEIPLKSIAESLEVSSLGGALPQDKDETVHEEVLRHFFPRGKYETELAERIIVGMLLGKDMYFHGPPGSGKSTAGKDIQKLARQQDLIFIVEGCQVQCNPFSLFDAEFGKRCPPCPECMINYDADFRETGRFTPPDPKTVKVTVAQYSEGHGIEFTEGTAGLRRYHIAGYKQPDLSGAKKTSSDFDPEGYTAGVLTRTNNGILLLEEADKLHPDLQHSLHEALEADRAKPDQMRFSVPANSLLLLTANDPSAFIDTLRDRMFGISIHYADNVDVAHEVTRAGYHGIVRPESVVVLPDTHAREPFDVWHTMMPVVLERAVEAFYIKFRAEYDGP
ncbi:MAG TPA: hypothetical protein VJK52_05480, partial [Candidatus Nanoarchaeia archaeon]|nr:hypothetical protein [Candidatus Nanoarchaeia archaeon]